MKKSFWKTIGLYTKGHERKIVISVLFSLITGVMVALQPLVIKYIVDDGILADIATDSKLKTVGFLCGLYILISFLQVSFIPVPSTLTIVIGSYLFGGLLAFIYSYIGILLGSIFAFYLGRKFGRKFVSWIIGDELKLDQYIEKLKGKETITIFFMFLFPFFPDDLLCSIAGLLPIKCKTFIIMQVISRITTIGGNILLLSGEIIPFSGWGIPVLILLGVLSIVIFILSIKNSEKITDFFSNFSLKITIKRKNE